MWIRSVQLRAGRNQAHASDSSQCLDWWPSAYGGVKLPITSIIIYRLVTSLLRAFLRRRYIAIHVTTPSKVLQAGKLECQ